MAFQYPYRVGVLGEELWQEILAAASAEHQAAAAMLSDGQVPLDETFDDPGVDLERLLGPRLNQLLAYLEDRDRALEDYINQPSALSVELYDMNPAAVDTSPYVTPHATLAATGLSATLSATLTGPTTVNLLRNGTVVQTVTVASGATYKRVTFPATVFQGGVDSYGISVTAVGTGTVRLGGEIEFS